MKRDVIRELCDHVVDLTVHIESLETQLKIVDSTLAWGGSGCGRVDAIRRLQKQAKEKKS